MNNYIEKIQRKMLIYNTHYLKTLSDINSPKEIGSLLYHASYIMGYLDGNYDCNHLLERDYLCEELLNCDYVELMYFASDLIDSIALVDSERIKKIVKERSAVFAKKTSVNYDKNEHLPADFNTAKAEFETYTKRLRCYCKTHGLPSPKIICKTE